MWFAASWFAGLAFIGSDVFGMGHHPNLRQRSRILLLVTVLAGAALGLTLVISAAIFYKQIGRYIVIICGTLFFLSCAGSRLLMRRRVLNSRHRLAIIGDAEFAASVDQLIADSPFPIAIERHIDPATTPEVATMMRLIDEAAVHEVVIDQLGPNGRNFRTHT
jgi:hypothetical protein